jgi:hypothetical protein
MYELLFRLLNNMSNSWSPDVAIVAIHSSLKHHKHNIANCKGMTKDYTKTMD